jgi:hypothetical protein
MHGKSKFALSVRQVHNCLSKDWIIPANELKNFKPRLMIDQLRHQMRRLKAPPLLVLGGIDGELDAKREYWQPHFHVIAAGMSRESLKALRRRFYQPNDIIRRPMVQKAVKDLARQVSYSYKPYWACRWRSGSRDRKDIFTRLPEPYHCNYLTEINYFGFTDLVFLFGAKKVYNELRIIELPRPDRPARTGADIRTAWSNSYYPQTTDAVLTPSPQQHTQIQNLHCGLIPQSSTLGNTSMTTTPTAQGRPFVASRKRDVKNYPSLSDIQIDYGLDEKRAARFRRRETV